MSAYVRTWVTADLVRLLGAIQRVNGWLTDIGENVTVGRRVVNDEEAPCVNVTPTEETAGESIAGRLYTACSYEITAYVDRRNTTVPEYALGPAEEYVLIDSMIGDIRSALETSQFCNTAAGQTLRFDSTESIFHEASGAACGVLLRYIVETAVAPGMFVIEVPE